MNILYLRIYFSDNSEIFDFEMLKHFQNKLTHFWINLRNILEKSPLKFLSLKHGKISEILRLISEKERKNIYENLEFEKLKKC